MAAAAKQGSATSGHGGFHPTVVVGGNGQFKIYGAPIATDRTRYCTARKAKIPASWQCGFRL